MRPRPWYRLQTDAVSTPYGHTPCRIRTESVLVAAWTCPRCGCENSTRIPQDSLYNRIYLEGRCGRCHNPKRRLTLQRSGKAYYVIVSPH